MIKIQKKNFNLEGEIEKIKNKHSDIGALTSFVGYVRDLNNNKDVKYLNLEVYEEMAFKELSKIEAVTASIDALESKTEEELDQMLMNLENG